MLLDVGGVLVENAGFAELRSLLPEAPADPELRLRWLESASVRAFELGRIAPTEFAKRFVDEWRIALSPDAFLEEFSRWPRGLFPGASDLLDALRARYRVACLTNSNQVHWDARPELRTLFHEVFSSHELGLIKPEPEIFRYVLERLSIAPARVAFFDDSAPNVEAAAAAGMRAHQVVGLEQLRSALARLDLLR
jgi:putative hydrolase of the HAD superfamily